MVRLGLLTVATLAQLVERFTRNEKVVGSIPTGGSERSLKMALK